MPIRQERSAEVVFYGLKAKPLSAAAEQAAEKLFSVVEAMLPADSEYFSYEFPILA